MVKYKFNITTLIVMLLLTAFVTWITGSILDGNIARVPVTMAMAWAFLFYTLVQSLSTVDNPRITANYHLAVLLYLIVAVCVNVVFAMSAAWWWFNPMIFIGVSGIIFFIALLSILKLVRLNV